MSSHQKNKVLKGRGTVCTQAFDYTYIHRYVFYLFWLCWRIFLNVSLYYLQIVGTYISRLSSQSLSNRFSQSMGNRLRTHVHQFQKYCSQPDIHCGGPLKIWLLTSLTTAAFPTAPHKELVYTTGLLPWFHSSNVVILAPCRKPRSIQLGSGPLSSFCWLLCPKVSDTVHSIPTLVQPGLTSVGLWFLLLLDCVCFHHSGTISAVPSLHEISWVGPTWNGPIFSCSGGYCGMYLGANISELVYSKCSPPPRSSLFSGSCYLVFGGPTCFTFWFVRVVKSYYLEDRQMSII